jgi:hypothetical protein
MKQFERERRNGIIGRFKLKSAILVIEKKGWLNHRFKEAVVQCGYVGFIHLKSKSQLF